MDDAMTGNDGQPNAAVAPPAPDAGIAQPIGGGLGCLARRSAQAKPPASLRSGRGTDIAAFALLLPPIEKRVLPILFDAAKPRLPQL